VLSNVLGADGSGADLLYVEAGGSKQPASHQSVANKQHYLKMKGREVFRFAVRIIPTATTQVLEQAGLTIEDLDLIVPHQANQRIIESAAKALGVPSDIIYSNVAQYGNTSAASIPIALCEAAELGQLHRDDLVVMVGFGGGLTWAATAVRWSSPLPAAPPSRWKKTQYSIRYRYAHLRSLIRRLVRWLWAQLTRSE
jgi:3-oxoacyl-[acyl-carrier-protein] synthase-3